MKITKKKIGALLAGILAVVALALAVLACAVTYQAPGAHFDSAGVKIHYTDEGAGVPVILIHGYTANADLNWRLPGLHKKLRQQFRVITMDVRGHGLSERPHDPAKYGIETVNDIARLMDHLQIPKAHLVGYSMGGFITLKFAATHSNRLLSAMPCGAAWMPPGDPLCSLLTNIHDDLTGKGAPSSGIGSPLTTLRRRALSFMMDLDALGAVAARFRELAISADELKAINVPVMAVKGGGEEVVLGGGDLMAALPGFKETIIPGGNHSSVIFYPAFHQSIIDFLRTHSPVPPLAA